MALDQPLSAKIARGYLGCSRSVYVARIAGEGGPGLAEHFQIKWGQAYASAQSRTFDPNYFHFVMKMTQHKYQILGKIGKIYMNQILFS